MHSTAALSLYRPYLASFISVSEQLQARCEVTGTPAPLDLMISYRDFIKDRIKSGLIYESISLCSTRTTWHSCAALCQKEGICFHISIISRTAPVLKLARVQSNSMKLN